MRESFLTILFFINTLLYSTLKILMNRLMTTSLFILLFSNIYSQESFSKLPKTIRNCPIIIVNNIIISNESFIQKNEGLITQMSIMKDKPNRQDHKFFNLSENGIVFAKINKKIKAKTQCELNEFFGIDKKNKIYVNGYLIEDSDYRIATESIIEIELITPNLINKLRSKLINVWTLTKKERLNSCQK